MGDGWVMHAICSCPSQKPTLKIRKDNWNSLVPNEALSPLKESQKLPFPARNCCEIINGPLLCEGNKPYSHLSFSG